MSIQLEISLSAYSKIERDETEISLKRLQQIAEILNVDLNTIINFDHELLLEKSSIKSANSHIELKNKSDFIYDHLREEIKFLRSLILQNKSDEN
jgi:transcriptional regulator with XRE-family HTH domain